MGNSNSKSKSRVVKGVLGLLAFMCIVGWGPMPTQCAPVTPPPPSCAGGIIHEYGINDGVQESYTATCSSGQGWVEIEIVCQSTEYLVSTGYKAKVTAKGYRPVDYVNPDAVNNMTKDMWTLSATCPRYQPYLWTPGVIVITYS